MRVEKRNGAFVDFEADKIKQAIEKAMAEVPGGMDEEISQKIAEEAEARFSDRDTVSIEEIQDFVEIQLMRYTPEVAKRYILYRVERAKLREHGWDMTDLQRDIYEKKYKYDAETFDEFLTRVSGGNEYIKKAIRDKRLCPRDGFSPGAAWTRSAAKSPSPTAM